MKWNWIVIELDRNIPGLDLTVFVIVVHSSRKEFENKLDPNRTRFGMKWDSKWFYI